MKKLFLYFLVVIFLSSCSTTKYVPENQLLLTKNTLYIDSINVKNNELNELLIQRPNAKVLGLPLSLHFYNIGNPNGSKTPKQWGENHPINYNFLKSVFSEKQSISVAKTFIGINNWFLRNGQPPIIIDDKKTKRTVSNLKSYYQTKGFFKARVHSKKNNLTPKKGTVDYYITKGKPLFIDSVSVAITSPVLNSIYNQYKEKSFLKSGEQYKDKNFINESNRLTKLFRNNGIYHFNINSIGFYDIDTTSLDYKTRVNLKIADRTIEKNGVYSKKPYEIQHIKKVNVYTDYSYSKKDNTPIEIKNYNGINFIAFNKIKYNPKFLSQSLFIGPNQIYSDSLRNLTRTHLRRLRNFKSTSILFNQIKAGELEANIYLTPTEKYTLGFETELSRSNIREFDISGKFSIIDRNVFRGSEILQLSFFGSYFNSRNGPGWDIGGDLSLEVPRFMAPFGAHKLVPKRMFPKTKFSTGLIIQKNIGLDKRNINVGINYNWQFNKRKKIQVELINAEYIRNLNVGNYFDIYNSELSKLNSIAKTYYKDPNITLSKNEATSLMPVISNDFEFKNTNPASYQKNANVYNRYRIITSDFLIPVTAYNFTYNNQKNYKDANFSFFRIRIANSGNVMGLLSKQTNDDGKKTVFKIPIAQYLKIDVEYKKFWSLGKTSVLAHRTFLGSIITYGDSDIPFSKSYFAGGSNDIRAWKTYDLGPGTTQPGLEYNIGSLKFLSSLEYRFDILGNLKGALFADAGNIWDITNSSLVDTTAKFDSLKSITDIALGTGFGIRYDFKFLVARFDVGFKTHEPYLSRKNRWFRNINFSEATYNIGINYPF